jgi:1-acyl-sn-glycerol-3-phosphate acyltransferase
MRVTRADAPPTPPFVLVSNHLSYVDVILLAARLPCVFVAKSDVAGWPVFGKFCIAVDTLFIRRDAKRDIPRVMRGIEAVLASGRGVVIFPEGTSSPGRAVLPFRAPLLEVAVRAGLPVHHASLTYRTPLGAPAAEEAVCWWDDTPFLRHLWRLLGLPRFDAEVSFGEEAIVENDRKLLAARLRHAVEREFRPVVSG